MSLETLEMNVATRFILGLAETEGCISSTDV